MPSTEGSQFPRSGSELSKNCFTSGLNDFRLIAGFVSRDLLSAHALKDTIAEDYHFELVW